mmetsp:Transcript_13731/g.22962  ORF Transcript_13731/g.22962 Transcript_13731/m.22962 type:complete len:228 (+) Transcript_13731:145-828(+)
MNPFYRISPPLSLSTNMPPHFSAANGPFFPTTNSEQDQPITDTTTDSPSSPNKKPRPFSTPGQSLTYESLQPYFSTSLASAAKQLGIGVTTLKSRCRLLGIKKWPYAQTLKERDLPAEAILPHVGLSEKHAARIVGASVDVFRRACKRHGITAWTAEGNAMMGASSLMAMGASNNRMPTDGDPLSGEGASSPTEESRDTFDDSSLGPSDDETIDSPSMANLNHGIGP